MKRDFLARANLKKISLFTFLVGLVFTFLVSGDVALTKAAPTDGAVDPNFGQVEGVNGAVYSVVVQSDNKILIGGSFTVYSNSSRNRIARLNPDGSLDTTFNPGSGANNVVRNIVLQSDSKIIIVGNFTAYNGIPRNRIARLNPDGSLDTIFNPGTGPNSPVEKATLQSDGKILIGGYFTSYSGTNRVGLVRLNPDGSLDTTFNPSLNRDIVITSIAVQADGKYLVGGNYYVYDAVSKHTYLKRLNLDGSLDTSFNPGLNLSNYSFIGALLIQPDNKILVGGYFYGDNPPTKVLLVRLNLDGTLENTFTPLEGTGTSEMKVSNLLLRDNGNIIVSMRHIFLSRTETSHIVELNPNGTPDDSFSFENQSIIFCLGLQTDGKIIVGGLFGSYLETIRHNLLRLNVDSSVDDTFLPGKYGSDGVITKLAIQPDGKIIIAGGFTRYKGILRQKIARLNSDSSLDISFDPGSNLDLVVETMKLQPDGKILVAGNSYRYAQNDPSQINYNYELKRLNADGSLDNSFEAKIPGGSYGQIYALAVQNDGKIIVGGWLFLDILQSGTFSLARLNPDGSLDNSFNAAIGYGQHSQVFAVTIQNDGKILVAGDLGESSVNDPNRQSIMRLNSDGSLDSTFNFDTGTKGRVKVITVQSDGKILIGGEFTKYNEVGRNVIARLNSNGSLDNSFNPGTGIANPSNYGMIGSIEALVVQSDGKILIGGHFNILNATGVDNITRLNSNGSLDTSFNTGEGVNYSVTSIALQNDNKIVLAGYFTSVDTYRRAGFARLENRQFSGITITSSPNPSKLDDTVTFKATLTPLTATGTVQFNFGSGAIVTSSISNGQATYVTNTLPAGVTFVSAAYSGDSNLGSSSTLTHIQIVTIPCASGVDPLVVTNSSDDGHATVCGNFSYALLNATSGTTITFALTGGNTVTFSGELTITVKVGVTIDGGAGAGVILDGSKVAGDGLRLAGSNILRNLTIRKFGGCEVVSQVGGLGNRFYHIRVEA